MPVKGWVVALLTAAAVLSSVIVLESITGRALAGLPAVADRSWQVIDLKAKACAPAPTPEAAQPADAIAATAAPVKSADDGALWRLTHAMMYWAHSAPVPRPSFAPFYPSGDDPKYITWEQDSAGMNNVRLQVENLVLAAHAFGRTLVMPEHLAGSMDHLRDGSPRFDDFFDFGDLARWIPVIGMQEYLDIRNVAADDAMRHDMGRLRAFLRDPNHNHTAFPPWSANRDKLPVPNEEVARKRTNPTLDEFANGGPIVSYTAEQQQAETLHFKHGDEIRLFGHCASFWYWPSQHWQDYMLSKMRDHFHFHRDIFVNASLVAHAIHTKFGGERFNAVHDRVDDFVKQFPNFYVDENTLRERLVQVLGGTDQPLYIATKGWNQTRWAPVMAAFPKVARLDDFLDEVLPGVPAPYLGPIEQVLCSVGARFVGTMGSTFTAYVHRLRGYHHTGLIPDKGVYYTNYPSDPQQYTATLANNRLQAMAVWWPRPNEPAQHHMAAWTRDFSFMWDFSASELPHNFTMFQLVR